MGPYDQTGPAIAPTIKAPIVGATMDALLNNRPHIGPNRPNIYRGPPEARSGATPDTGLRRWCPIIRRVASRRTPSPLHRQGLTPIRAPRKCVENMWQQSVQINPESPTCRTQVRASIWSSPRLPGTTVMGMGNLPDSLPAIDETSGPGPFLPVPAPNTRIAIRGSSSMSS